jgi:hypothetical protein
VIQRLDQLEQVLQGQDQLDVVLHQAPTALEHVKNLG